MREITICLKHHLNEEDCRKINELKDICTEKEDIFLKLEIEFKFNMAQIQREDSFKHANDFFCFLGETPIGYLGMLSMDGQTAELTGMVHPLYRKQGIFKRLYSLAIEDCRRRNFKKILLVCDSRSSSGLAFIKASGAVYSFSEYEMKLNGNYESAAGNDITLRKAQNSDFQEIERQNSIYFGVPNKTITMPEDEEKRNRITYMIESGSRIIGKIRVDFNNDEGFISGFGILPDYRHRGYGRQALKAALGILSKNNIHTAALEVAAQNKNALNLYKSCGFVEESVTDYYEC